MKVEIVSPEGKLLDTEATLVSLPGVNGAFEILDHHAPIIALLGKGTVRVVGDRITVDEDVEDKFEILKGEVRLPFNSGTIEMKQNRLIVLVE
ncbi:MAG: F0F1 ATP synthase subunit epsilon [Chlorobi bacterium]|nr:F0F1 ATP synthase subunit epsilon [Chlorobiota bacterium]